MKKSPITGANEGNNDTVDIKLAKLLKIIFKDVA